MEHNGKLVGVLARDVEVIQLNEHSENNEIDNKFTSALEAAELATDVDDYMGRKAHVEKLLGRKCTKLECQHIEKTIQDDEAEEVVAEKVFGSKSPKHGARPKLVGVPILR